MYNCIMKHTQLSTELPFIILNVCLLIFIYIAFVCAGEEGFKKDIKNIVFFSKVKT